MKTIQYIIALVSFLFLRLVMTALPVVQSCHQIKMFLHPKIKVNIRSRYRFYLICSLNLSLNCSTKLHIFVNVPTFLEIWILFTLCQQITVVFIHSV